jgi:hypothetical protein
MYTYKYKNVHTNKVTTMKHTTTPTPSIKTFIYTQDDKQCSHFPTMLYSQKAKEYSVCQLLLAFG